MRRLPIIPFEKKSAVSPNDAMDMLFEVFEDKYPKMIAEDTEKWFFQLNWPTDLAWYVDPNLISVLSDYKVDNVGSLPDYCIFEKTDNIHIIVSMFHSKAILAATGAINNNFKINSIIHIDDHSDLMAPMLFYKRGQIKSSLFQDVIKFEDAKLIEKCIEHGVIGIGSFLSAFAIMTEPGSIFHIKQPLSDYRGPIYSLHPKVESLNIGGKQISRTFLEKVENNDKGLWKYQNIGDLAVINGNLGNVWLDIDLDYFSNRYNKDSDWKKNINLDPSKDEVFQLMQKTLEKIINSKWTKDVRVLSISYSPGFFPSEYFIAAKNTFIEPLIAFFKSK
ncbi:hypothetical protein [Paenibacillus planticolens]|uniref:Arginase n=1 Tax=Paenibacillus planticolens TaxID=2654976 RepID=A0ABX1ZJ53_9BACL|nr:hypothetical protein [Paenibacillus planticolens]NOU99482.1 hypothetical protein [Paenibacillus planticolens]